MQCSILSMTLNYRGPVVINSDPHSTMHRRIVFLDFVRSTVMVNRRLNLNKNCVSSISNCGSWKSDVLNLAVSAFGHRIEFARVMTFYFSRVNSGPRISLAAYNPNAGTKGGCCRMSSHYILQNLPIVSVSIV